MAIKRIGFYKKDKVEANFEIVTLKQFFSTRPMKLIERDARLNFWSMIYITGGEGIHSIDFREYQYKEGDLIVLSKNQVHSYRVNLEVEGYIININEPFFIENGENKDMDMLAFFETPYGEPVLQIDISQGATSRQLMELIYKEYLSADASSRKLIKSLFASFIYSVRNENSENIRKLSVLFYEHYYEYRELVEENFTKFKAVLDYEKLMGLNKKTINLSCRQCAGISAKEVITYRIILEVKRLIVQGKMKNYEISDALGFDEPANLAGFFKRYTGMSMRDFRKQEERGFKEKV